MTRFRLRWHWIAGVIIIGSFVTLLSLRLEVFHLSNVEDLPDKAVTLLNAEEYDTWMQIFQDGRKIGYAHRVLIPGEQGYDFADTVYMRIKTMGVVQGLTLLTRGTLNHDMALSNFSLRLTSNLFHFAARGKRVGTNLTLYVGDAGEEKSYELALKDVPYLSENVADAAFRSGLKMGEEKTLSVFDPASMGVRPVKISLVRHEVIKIAGETKKLTKMAIDFMGARQFAWVDDHGQVMREEGMLGMSLERSSKSQALSGLTSDDYALSDITELASVASNTEIGDPVALNELKVKIMGIDTRQFNLDGGRQSFRDGLLSIRKEALGKSEGVKTPPDAKEKELFLKSTPFVQADHPQIRAALMKIVSPKDSPGTRMRKIVDWVNLSLLKQPVLSVSNAVETLAQRKGDCTEHAVLVAALGRAAGIPTSIETGLVYQRGRFYYHAWNVFWIDEWDGWITADAVFGQVPADVTHIRLVRGEAQEQLDLVGILGRIKLEVLK
ncbi:MAG: transglutaminase-like domain-containing protein [Syntrophales bacterium]|nr:transglutaminase-like domain-containing protein [Syntrophales bacterium]